jgi:hypothetical protein
MPQYLKSEPPVVPLDVQGPFIRLGEQTYIHYDQIAGFRTVEVPIWGGPSVPAPVEEDEDEGDEEVEVVLIEDTPEGRAEAQAAENAEKSEALAAAKARVEAAQAVMDANAKSLAEAPRVGMVQVYLHNRYGSLMVDTPDGAFTSTPLIRHSIEALMAAMDEASANRAKAEARIMSGMIAREINNDLGEQVEELPNTPDDRI